MATHITPTPILYGQASVKFNKTLLAEQDIKVSVQERERIDNLVKKVLFRSLEK